MAVCWSTVIYLHHPTPIMPSYFWTKHDKTVFYTIQVSKSHLKDVLSGKPDAPSSFLANDHNRISRLSLIIIMGLQQFTSNDSVGLWVCYLTPMTPSSLKTLLFNPPTRRPQPYRPPSLASIRHQLAVCPGFQKLLDVFGISPTCSPPRPNIGILRGFNGGF